MLTPFQVASLPVGAIPWNGPLCVPRAVKRTTTFSPSEKMSSIVVWRSGKAARRPVMSRFTPSGPDAAGPEGEVVAHELRGDDLVDGRHVTLVRHLLEGAADDGLVLLGHGPSFHCPAST